MQPGAAFWQVVEVDARQWLAEDAFDVLEVDEFDVIVCHGPGGMLVEAENADGLALGCDFFEEGLEILAVGGGDDVLGG